MREVTFELGAPANTAGARLESVAAVMATARTLGAGAVVAVGAPC